LFTLSCGYKVINETKINNFSIKEINTTGDKRINFKIKSNLQSYTTNINEKDLIVNLNTKKGKNIKEKNIKNEITKYQISINVNIIFKVIGEDKEYTLDLISNGDYLVADNYSTTLNNEKKLIDDLIENISEKIIKKISLKLYDIKKLNTKRKFTIYKRP